MRWWGSFAFACVALAGQDRTGAISGIVTDRTGAVIAGATVSLPGGVEVRSNEAGRFVLTDLAPGSHAVKLHSPGFLDREVNVAVEPGKSTEIVADMEVNPNIGNCGGQPPRLEVFWVTWPLGTMIGPVIVQPVRLCL